MIRRKSDNAIECIGTKENGLYWITEEQFLYLAHVDLHQGTNQNYLHKTVVRDNRDSEPRIELGNLVHDAENYFSDYSLVAKDEKAICVT